MQGRCLKPTGTAGKDLLLTVILKALLSKGKDLLGAAKQIEKRGKS